MQIYHHFVYRKIFKHFSHTPYLRSRSIYIIHTCIEVLILNGSLLRACVGSVLLNTSSTNCVMCMRVGVLYTYYIM